MGIKGLSDDPFDLNEITKAINVLESKSVQEPYFLLMSKEQKNMIIEGLKKEGIETKGEDGKDYILGVKVLIPEELFAMPEPPKDGDRDA